MLKKSGKCEYCGTGNKCCRKGWKGGESSCSSSEGGNGYHTCVSGHAKSTLNNKVLELRCTSDNLALVSSDIRGFDQDFIIDKLRYEIIGGNVMNTFEIDSVSGNLFAKVHRLDFEKMSKYSLKIQIVDDGLPARSSTAVIDIYVLNVNEAPTLLQSYEYSVNENTPDGVNVGHPIQATDPDDNEAFTYKLETSGVPFSLGSVNGQITVRNSKVIFSKFESSSFDGWTCGAITTCGSFGKYAVGLGKRGRQQKLRKHLLV